MDEANRSHKQFRILLVDDDEDDYLLTRILLMEAKGSQFELEWASSFEAGLESARLGAHDAVLVDYKLGKQNGLQLARQILQSGVRTPVILLTGQGSYEVDVEAMKAGVADYLIKDESNSALLERTIRYAIERGQNEEALRLANDELARARDELEQRVQERTQELLEANQRLIALNEELKAEISERMRVEAELAEIQSRLIDSAEAERLQLAQEVHDGPMQELYAITYQLTQLADPDDGDERNSLVQSSTEGMNGVIRTLRAITRELRPPNLVEFGLENAIRSHIESFRSAKPDLKIDLDLMPDDQKLPERVRLALFRIYQVALVNVVRHAQASQVLIRLKLETDTVILEIQDNGCGFSTPWNPIQMAREGHLGLVSAQERAQAVGGSLQITSRPGKGALIRVLVPINKQ